MMQLNLKRGFHRIFAILVACWTLYWLFLAPFHAGYAVIRHYEKDMNGCFVAYSSAVPDRAGLDQCQADAEDERRKGLYTGLGFDLPQGWTYATYWFKEWEFLAVVITIPALIVYGLAFAVALVLGWIGRGFTRSG